MVSVLLGVFYLEKGIKELFQTILCTMEHCKSHHWRAEGKRGQHGDTNKNRTSSKSGTGKRIKVIKKPAKWLTTALKELQKYLANTGHFLYGTTIYRIRYTSQLWGAVTRR